MKTYKYGLRDFNSKIVFLINQKNYLRIKIPETILISLHQINLINNFNRVIGLKDGEIVIDREIHNINQSEFDWLF